MVLAAGCQLKVLWKQLGQLQQMKLRARNLLLKLGEAKGRYPASMKSVRRILSRLYNRVEARVFPFHHKERNEIAYCAPCETLHLVALVRSRLPLRFDSLRVRVPNVPAAHCRVSRLRALELKQSVDSQRWLCIVRAC